MCWYVSWLRLHIFLYCCLMFSISFYLHSLLPMSRLLFLPQPHRPVHHPTRRPCIIFTASKIQTLTSQMHNHKVCLWCCCTWCNRSRCLPGFLLWFPKMEIWGQLSSCKPCLHLHEDVWGFFFLLQISEMNELFSFNMFLEVSFYFGKGYSFMKTN